MVRTLDPKKREKFLQAALRLFVAHGAQHTSTAEIAQAAGTAAGTLFLYFPTKQALIDALVLQIAEQQSAYIQSLLAPDLPARETFFTIWNGSLRWFLDHPEAYQFQQQTRESHLVGEEVVQATALHLGYYFTAIQRGLQENVLHPYPLEMIGGFFYQDIVAVMDLLRAQPDPARQAEWIQAGFDIFWNGIRQY